MAVGDLMTIGVDEVGRGCLAGPVFACAFHFEIGSAAPVGLRDSKKLTPKARERLAPQLSAAGKFSLGSSIVAEIDALGIVEANFLAMQRALVGLVADLGLRKSYRVIVDGDTLPSFGRIGFGGMECLVKADDLVPEVSAASVIAKVLRDQHMADLAACHPGYALERNAGYGSAAHMAALREIGPSEAHRRTFEPIRSLLASNTSGQCAPGNPNLHHRSVA